MELAVRRHQGKEMQGRQEAQTTLLIVSVVEAVAQALLAQLELHLQMVLGVQVVLALRQAFQAHLLHTLVVVVALRMVLERRVLAVQVVAVIAEQAQAQLV